MRNNKNNFFRLLRPQLTKNPKDCKNIVHNLVNGKYVIITTRLPSPTCRALAQHYDGPGSIPGKRFINFLFLKNLLFFRIFYFGFLLMSELF